MDKFRCPKCRQFYEDRPEYNKHLAEVLYHCELSSVVKCKNGHCQHIWRTRSTIRHQLDKQI